MPVLTHRDSRSRTSVKSVLLLGLLILSSVGLAAAITLGELRLAVMSVILFVLFAMSLIEIRLSILGLFGFLTILGDLRRLLIPLVGWTGADPILLIAPFFTVLVLGYTLTTRRLSTSSVLSRWMLLFTGIMILQIFNPNQGDLIVGVAGGILVIVPTFWFWIGQAFGSATFLRTFLFSLLVPLSVLALAMGYVQLSYGYLPYQLDWYDLAGYISLGDSPENLRPISIFPNITEYLSYLSIAVVALTAALLHKSASTRLKQTAFFLVPLGLTALLLSGSRGPLVMTVVVILLMWTIKGQSLTSWAPRLAVAALLGVMGFAWSLNQVSDLATSDRMQANVARQTELIETGGTASVHAHLAWMGIQYGFENPLGLGIGSITLAAKKFDGASFNTEKDITNMFVATGALGGIIYFILVGIVGVTAIRYWIRTRSFTALLLFGVLAVTGLTWLTPGHYVTTPIVWLLIGILDRESRSAGNASATETD